MELSPNLWVCPVATDTNQGKTSFELCSINQHSFDVKQCTVKRPSAMVLELESSSDSETESNSPLSPYCSPPVQPSQLDTTRFTNTDTCPTDPPKPTDNVSQIPNETTPTNMIKDNTTVNLCTESSLRHHQPMTKRSRSLSLVESGIERKKTNIPTDFKIQFQPVNNHAPVVGRSNSSVIDCPFCGRTFAGRRSLNIHLNKTHSIRDTNLIDLNSTAEIRKMKTKLATKIDKPQSITSLDKDRNVIADKTNSLAYSSSANEVKSQKPVDSGSSPLCESVHSDTDYHSSNPIGTDLMSPSKSPKSTRDELHISKSKRTVYAVSPPAQSGLKIRLVSLPSAIKHPSDTSPKSNKTDSFKPQSTQISPYSNPISTEPVRDQTSTPASTSSLSSSSSFLFPSTEDKSMNDNECSNNCNSTVTSLMETNMKHPSTVTHSLPSTNSTNVTGISPTTSPQTESAFAQVANKKQVPSLSISSNTDSPPKPSIGVSSRMNSKLPPGFTNKAGTMDTTLRTKEGLYGCRICNRSFANRYSLTGHYKSHYEPDQKPYFCDDCGQRYTSPSNLHYHRGRNCPVLKLQAINEGKLTPSSVHNRKLLELKVLRAVERKALIKQGKQGAFGTNGLSTEKSDDATKTTSNLTLKRPLDNVQETDQMNGINHPPELGHSASGQFQTTDSIGDSPNVDNPVNLFDFINPSNVSSRTTNPNQLEDYFRQLNNHMFLPEKLREQLQTMPAFSPNNSGSNGLFNPAGFINPFNDRSSASVGSDWKSSLLNNALGDPNLLGLFSYLCLLGQMNMKNMASMREQEPSPNNLPGFRCPHCRYDIHVFRDSQGLDKHISLVHPEYVLTGPSPLKPLARIPTEKSILPPKLDTTSCSSSVFPSKAQNIPNSMVCYAQSSECMKPALNHQQNPNLVSCNHCDRGFSTYAAFRVHHTKTHQTNRIKTSRNPNFSRSSLTNLAHSLDNSNP